VAKAVPRPFVWVAPVSVALVFATVFLDAILGSCESLALLIVGGVLIALVSVFLILGLNADIEKLKGPSALIILAVLVTVVAASVMALGIGRRLIGTSAFDVSVVDIKHHPYAKIFHLRDGHVANEFVGKTDLMAGSAKSTGHIVGSALAAPIVPDGFKPDDEIDAWAVTSELRSEYRDGDQLFAHGRQEWTKPARGAVRAAGIQVSDFREAIAEAEQTHHLRSAPDAALLILTDDPERVSKEGWERAESIAGVASFIVFMLLGLWRLLAAGRRSPPHSSRRR
jgi:hypothetical protein